MRRVDCRHCGRIITEAIPWASGKHRLTNDFRIFLAQWSRLLSWKDRGDLDVGDHSFGDPGIDGSSAHRQALTR
jgi:hypothetical protein